MALNVAISKAAEKQYARLTGEFQATVDRFLEHRLTRHDLQNTSRWKDLGPAVLAEAGNLMRFRSGSLRILAVVNDAECLVVGFGVRRT
jgi:mRNA-degrading endonuclease RelE of RelBE toxin-antitoxin system